MLHFPSDAALGQLRCLANLPDGADGADRNAAFRKERRPVVAGSLQEDGFENSLQFAAVGRAVGGARKTWLVQQIRPLDRAAEGRPEAIIRDTKVEPAVGSPKGFVRTDRRVGISPASRALARGEVDPGVEG